MVHVIVCVKRVPDTESTIKIKPDGKSIDTTAIEYIMNPYDEFAVEEALKIKEDKGGEVSILCLGPSESTKEIRRALAMGADKAVHLKDEAEYRDAFSAASILAKVRRDRFVAELREEHGDFGSGYSSDRRTISFLESWFEDRDDCPPFMRCSWATVRRIRAAQAR